MGFIDLNLGEDVKEKDNAPEGAYDLVVIDVAIRDYEADNDGESVTSNYIMILHEIEGDGNYKKVFHQLWLPTSFDDTDKTYNKQVGIKKYLSAAGVPFEASGFNIEDIQGARFSCNLGIETDDSGKYDDRNNLKLPRLPSE